MKKLFVLFFLMAMSLQAATVNLAWDASASTGVQGYALYNKDFQHPYNYTVPIWEGATLTATVTVVNDRQTAFVARAWVWGVYDLQGNRTKMWSDNSNEEVFIPDQPKPQPPSNFIIKILVALAKFFRGLWA
jgi:hypothetical protein